MSARKLPAGTAPLLIAVLLATTTLIACGSDDSDPSVGKSGLIIFTDDLTGCQYLARPSHNRAPEPLTPRMRPDGHQVCEQNGQAR